ncbi:hypothetical protein [Isoptericola aurantiacus]|uniref:hypothetical protein n=1 Tax=Isoptericola aurantiacus TaxID=3377839 RepID=UPI00383AFE87
MASDDVHGEVMRPGLADPTTFALDMIRRDLRDRFDGLDKRLDQMVTREAHEATVRRLDDADSQLRRAQEQHEKEAEARHERLAGEVRDADDKVLKQLEADRKQRAAEIAKAAADRKADRRWTVGAVLAAAGIAVPLAAFIRDAFGF